MIFGLCKGMNVKAEGVKSLHIQCSSLVTFEGVVSKQLDLFVGNEEDASNISHATREEKPFVVGGKIVQNKGAAISSQEGV